MAEEQKDFLYFAVKIPKSQLSQIKIDGELSDWMWMAPSFVDLYDFPFTQEGDSENDFDIEAWVAWNPVTNMLYHAIKVTDDQLSTLPLAEAGDMYRWDVVQIYIDGDNSGGDYREVDNSSQAQQYYLYCLPDGRSGHLGLFGPEEQFAWSLKPPYAQYAVHYDGKVIYYEVAIKIWDWLGPSSQQSKLHYLKAGEAIGWKLTVKDRDGFFDSTKGCTLRPEDSWKNADYFAKLKLLP